MKKLAVISTHPIQYNAPFFKMLAERNNISLKVFYTWSQAENGIKFDPGFGKNIEWNIPLLEGYNYVFVENVAKDPGSHHFKGINNPTLINEIQHWGANVILLYGWNFKSHFKVLRFFKGKIPIFFRGDSTLLNEKVGLKKLVRRVILKYIYSFVDMAFYAGKANKAYFIEHGFKENKLVFMPHAIDNSRFAPSIEYKKAGINIRKLLAIPIEATVFLYAGKLEEKKQPDFLAKAFSQMNNQNSFLILAGTGILESSLKNIYAANHRIKFMGFVNQQQMPELYASCDVFILPSKGPNETWGLSINEAMAAAKAVVVSTACGAAFDLVINQQNGFVFEKSNENMLKKALSFFMKNKYAPKEMGEKSLKIIKDYSYLNDCVALEEAVIKVHSNYNI